MEYFKCDRDCAMFVAMDRMSAPDSSKTISSHETVQPHPSQADGTSIKLGDSVTFYDKKDTSVNRVVRWIGINTNAMSDNSKIVGIEMVSCIILYNLEITINLLSLTNCGLQCKLFYQEIYKTP